MPLAQVLHQRGTGKAKDAQEGTEGAHKKV
jgi:hypothetical protein